MGWKEPPVETEPTLLSVYLFSSLRHIHYHSPMASSEFFLASLQRFLDLGHGGLVAAVVGLVLLVAVKRRYFTSIRDIPGPFVASFSSLWQIYHLFKGHTEVEIIKLHRKHGTNSSSRRNCCPFCALYSALVFEIYLTVASLLLGDFVRIAENEVSVAHPDAVRLLLHANIRKVHSCIRRYQMESLVIKLMEGLGNVVFSLQPARL